ncbi:hypothetical protein FQA39_LY11762 [Lamprigera yunnana]|nr:hypothetical protein FQA39_LY11762 [Lamprigera yunnana]
MSVDKFGRLPRTGVHTDKIHIEYLIVSPSQLKSSVSDDINAYIRLLIDQMLEKTKKVEYGAKKGRARGDGGASGGEGKGGGEGERGPKRSKQYVIFKEEEWIQFHEQRENINKYFQIFDTMWKPRQIGSKTLTFEMIEEKKILKIEDMSGNEVYLEIQFIKKMWILYSQEHWTKAFDLKSAVERLYEELGALEFDADHEAIYGMERYYTVQQCEELRDKYKIGRKGCRKFLQGKTCSQSLVKRIREIRLRNFLDTIHKYIKDCSDSSSSSDEEVFKTVEQNGEETTEEEE